MPDTLTGTSGGTVWANDNATLFYVDADRELAAVSRQVASARDRTSPPIATSTKKPSGTFFVSVDKTQSEAFMLIGAGDHVTNEMRFIPADAPDTPPR